MPLRDRLKKTFSRTHSSSRTRSAKSSKSSSSSDPGAALYYKPGEPLPLKYRRPVDKAHQALLDSFSFETAWRRRSVLSQVSPMASRAPSRSNSVVLSVDGAGACESSLRGLCRESVFLCVCVRERAN